MERILIFGASGFIGQRLFRELQPYFDVYGTFCHATAYEKNQRYCPFDIREESPLHIVKQLKPTIIISALRSDFAEQVVFHEILTEYISKNKIKLFFLSSANVFDAFTNYPSYEHDKTLSESIYGRLKIKIENRVMRMPKHLWAILRLPMVFGAQSPRLQEIKTQLSERIPIEIYPNSIINVTSDRQLTRQTHYLINRKKTGIFHLGSKDLIHHDEFVEKLVGGLSDQNPIWKRVYTSNNDRYLAMLQRDNKLPKYLHFDTEQVLSDCLGLYSSD
ncbi:MAG: sugar nucleotide-binding protein [Flavobacteriaceae bacterium]